MPFAAAAAAATAYSAYTASETASDANDAQRDATQKQYDISRRQQDIADEQYQTYKDTYQPLEKQYVESAQSYGSIANKNKAATQAAADVTSSFAGLRDQLTKSPGINQNSQAYLNKAADIGLAEAAQKATAETGARDKVQAVADAKMTDAISLGKGLAANAQSGLSASQSGLASAGASLNAAAARANGNANSAWGAVGGMLTNKDLQGTVKSWGSSLNSPQSSSPTNAQLEAEWGM